MIFSFNAKTFKDLFHNAVAEYVDAAVPDKNDINSPQNLSTAMDQAIDVMERVDADSAAKKEINTENMGLLEEKDISKIGQYTLDLLEGMVTHVQNKTGEQNRELIRLSVPVSLWVARHGGKLSQIDMPVNSLAGFANEISEPHALAELTAVIKEIIDACDAEICRDVEQTNMMRPWRILNLNYGIVATRSYQTEIIERVYETLMKNLPQDARQFFKEGLQQMDAIGYPDEVREVVERYNKMWGSESSLH
ncbi:hypothetical protein MNBD_GAMMA06-88 [hydrothermal vent metagenome]|uniref:Uncharacterized protein n=1 Tax=hydrothermal vent metagenome TaxID=652676 RepID=A0A3B0W3U9_9ZZZZ